MFRLAESDFNKILFVFLLDTHTTFPNFLVIKGMYTVEFLLKEGEEQRYVPCPCPANALPSSFTFFSGLDEDVQGNIESNHLKMPDPEEGFFFNVDMEDCCSPNM